MSRARNRRLPILRTLVLIGLGGTWAIACGGPQPLGAAGSVCFRADECHPGLACVPESLGASKHVCSADLSGIVSMVDGAAPEAGDMPEAMGGSPAAPQAGSPSTGTPPSAGAAGKPAMGGAPGTGGGPTGGSPAAGAPPAGGASSAGAPAAGSSAAGNANGSGENGGASAGTGG
jgi:hypothetical protein